MGPWPADNSCPTLVLFLGDVIDVEHRTLPKKEQKGGVLWNSVHRPAFQHPLPSPWLLSLPSSPLSPSPLSVDR